MTAHEASRLDKMEEKLDDLTQSVEEIKKALLGSEFTNGKGLVKEMEETKSRVDILERWKIQVVSGALAAGVVCGWMISRVWEFFNK